MASRLLTFVSCTLYFSFLVGCTTIGLTSITIGLVGLGFYIPTSTNYSAYNINICYIFGHEYDTCQQENDIPSTHCYSVMWSVEYIISNSLIERYVFSTITQTYRTSIEALDKLKIYKDKSNYTCYYRTTHIADVRWDKPKSPKPYLIMMIVGFSLTAIYFIVIVVITLYEYRR